jgi:hypothetical protein
MDKTDFIWSVFFTAAVCLGLSVSPIFTVIMATLISFVYLVCLDKGMIIILLTTCWLMLTSAVYVLIDFFINKI